MKWCIYGSVEWQNSMDRMLGTLEAEAAADEADERHREFMEAQDGDEA